MAADEEYHDDPNASGSYSQLLFADDVNVVNLDSVECFNFSSHFSSENQPKMLCFGDREWYDSQLVENSSTGVAEKDSSHISLEAINDSIKLSKPNKKRDGSLVKEPEMKQTCVKGVRDAASGNLTNSKKTMADNSTLLGHAKTHVKKVKLGERITALQQIVSPFGKTDTASVLHEATGYIKFLHDQLQVLSSPYLHRLPTSAHLSEGEEKLHIELPRRDLRSRGLCLIPVELTSHVAESNGADFWSPAMVNNCDQQVNN
ncbi:hypothetical protein Leryth_014118 [Lithospermum erythrorhizon]|nr:hypothetical protein Leryth_014118 [Lithospermum erythrorhizon]